MALTFGIGAVKKTTARGRKKTTTSKTKAKTTTRKTTAKKAAPKTKGKKPTAGSKVSSTGKRYYPSTPAKSKSYKVSRTCKAAGSELKSTGSSEAGAVLALCRASVKNLNMAQKVLSKNRVRRNMLSRKK